GNNPPSWAQWPWHGMLWTYLIAAPLVAAGIFAPRAWQQWQSRTLRREVIYPAARVACQILGVKFRRRDAVQMINLPPNFGEELDDDAEPGSVRVYLPPVPLDKGTKERLERNVGARLGMPNPSAEWHEAGGRAFVDLLPAEVPPATVTLADVREAIESAPIERPVIGVASGRRTISADFDNDSPHLAASGGSGTGKSTLFRLIAAQRLARGAGAVFLDLKRWSHSWAHGLPADRALYFYKIEDIHNALVEINCELRRRIEMDKEDLPRLRTVDVYLEELNSLIPALQDYWTELRAEIRRRNKAALADDPYADVAEPPVKSPAVQAIGYLINQGRELRMHAHAMGQRLSAAAFGGNGGDRRESFQTRMLAKWTRQTWRMLVPGVPFRVCPQGPRGIWAVVNGDTVDIVRVPELSPDQARALALSGPAPTCPVLGGVMSRPAMTVPGQRDSLEDSGRTVKLSEAVSVLPGRPLSLDALRKASQRDGFPAPVGQVGSADLYRYADLEAWKLERDARARAVS
ncbi:MAG TPA: type IV secretory system conjugative DNA transfer family protein, partial [Armatimonadota bacterium]|nr:type IV secretory system conjugative DNA transfer family protein [Armatimonadota bacterium]